MTEYGSLKIFSLISSLYTMLYVARQKTQNMISLLRITQENSVRMLRN
jgi:hypothetical protein